MYGQGDLVNSVELSGEGERIMSTSDDRTIRVWDVKTSPGIGAALKGHTDPVMSAVFSPDGARVTSVSRDGTLRIWEPEEAGEVSAASEGYCTRALLLLQRSVRMVLELPWVILMAQYACGTCRAVEQSADTWKVTQQA